MVTSYLLLISRMYSFDTNTNEFSFDINTLYEPFKTNTSFRISSNGIGLIESLRLLLMVLLLSEKHPVEGY